MEGALREAEDLLHREIWRMCVTPHLIVTWPSLVIWLLISFLETVNTLKISWVKFVICTTLLEMVLSESLHFPKSRHQVHMESIQRIPFQCKLKCIDALVEWIHGT